MGKDSKDKEVETRAQGQTAPASRRFLRYCLVLLLAGAAGMAWLSVLTFVPTDPPARTVCPAPPVRNVGGDAGAHLAYVLLYWLGDGTYMLLLFATIAAAVMLFGGRVGDWPWRIFGLTLMVTATSAASHILQPVSADGLLEGNGGIVGIAVGGFLLDHFASTGSWLVLLVTFGVAVMLTADKFVLQLPHLGKKLWRKHGAAFRGIGWPSPGKGVDLRTVPAAPRRAAAALARTPVKPRPEKKPEPLSPLARPLLAAAPAALRLPRPAPTPTRQPRDKPAKEGEYQLPGLDLLTDPTGGYLESQEAVVTENRAVLQQTLDDFGVEAQVVSHMTGPVISLFELSLAPGVKVSRIDSLARDIARALAVPGVRVVSPLPGRDTVGIEVPNLDKEIVRLKELMTLAPGAAGKMQLPLYLGKNASGDPIVADLASMPHLLLAGTTGSGKSVCINGIIAALLLTRTPADVRLILIDPKMVEMAALERIPHLLCPIVNEIRRVEDVLGWATAKMDERYELFKEAGVRNIIGFNRLDAEELHRRLGAETDEEKAQIATHMPYIVVIVDELADLIMTSSKEVEGHIIRIAQKARAVGIHLIVATQRPSVNVVTGLIKSNMPCRISFRVASRQESRIVLDQNGADVLLGQGDMLFLQPGTSHLIRAQGTYVDEGEIRALVNHVRSAAQPVYCDELVKLQAAPSEAGTGERDELFDEAVEIVLESQRGSVSLLQRRLKIGYSRASRVIDQMAEAGILGDYKGSQARECLMALEDWQALKASIQADQSGASAADGTPTSV
ncbi:MAG TPA: DNA translocase FtsK 4TM domain-containing protein [Phycisphaerae bacterium]|nr:DNA translocase FtsK 4TM domain-containing protein [Phycisphaerae bacterium]